MGKLINEINRFAKEEDKPVLLWLVNKYSWSSQWYFLAKFESFAGKSGGKIWIPTEEGRILYNHFNADSTE